MLNYRGKPAMEAALARGRSRVEQYAEERLYDRDTELGRVTRSVSYALLLFSAGLLFVLFYLLVLK